MFASHHPPSNLAIQRPRLCHMCRSISLSSSGIYPPSREQGCRIERIAQPNCELKNSSGSMATAAAATSPQSGGGCISVKDQAAAAVLRAAPPAAVVTMAREENPGAHELGLMATTTGEHQNLGFMGKAVSQSPPDDEIWLRMREEARRDAEAEPSLASYLYSTILAHRSLERALAFHLGNKLASSTLLSTHLFTMIVDAFLEDASIREAIRADISAVRERDPACVSYSHCMLNFKGFLACQAYRVAHRLWKQGRLMLALAIQSRVSEVFHVDVHPGAMIGRGVLFDHATGLVVGETATIGNNVSILHNVTLGGTGACCGDRHPKVGDGVLIGAGAILLGNIKVGEGAKIGAGSVVLIDVPPHTTAVGNPARILGPRKGEPAKLKDIPSETMDHTSFIANWSDYVI